jgi:glycosyltransferase involved in cell wall biosynthesis
MPSIKPAAIARRRILIVHYTPPGVIGGVEHVIREHVRLLEARGCDVVIVAGRRGRGRRPVRVIPEMDAARPQGVRIERELAEGRVSDEFSRLRDRIRSELEPLVQSSDVVIVHNAFTLHFSLPLTAALWEIAAGRTPGTMIAWSHDLAWSNPLYMPALHAGYPWDLLRRPAPNTRYVTVSTERKLELAALWGRGEDDITVIPNGIDVATTLGLSRATREIVDRYRLFDRDAVLLLPVRITRRKNIEAGIRAVGELRDRGLDVRFLISGPVAPHHPQRSMLYLRELKRLRAELELDEQVVFLADALGVPLSTRTVNELYRITDALLFPSEQEGFGLPVLEAGLMRVPAVVSAIPIFRELGQEDIVMFQLDESAARIAERIEEALGSKSARLFKRVVRNFRWDAIADQCIMPLLQR